MQTKVTVLFLKIAGKTHKCHVGACNKHPAQNEVKIMHEHNLKFSVTSTVRKLISRAHEAAFSLPF